MPTLTSAAAQANQICRTQVDKALGDLFAERELETTEDAAFHLTADPENDTFHVAGFEDETLIVAIKESLNHGKSNRNLYTHLEAYLS